jgi:hypothetical protein
MNKSVFWMHVFDMQIYAHFFELFGSGRSSIFVKNHQVFSYQAGVRVVAVVGWNASLGWGCQQRHGTSQHHDELQEIHCSSLQTKFGTYFGYLLFVVK